MTHSAKVVRVQGLPCQIVGVLRAKGVASNGQDQDDFVVLPYTTVAKRVTGTFWLDDIFCSAVSTESMQEATKQITALLRERHHLNPGEDDDFNVRRPRMSFRHNWLRARLCGCFLPVLRPCR